MAKARRRYSTKQIVAALKQAELGLPVADLISILCVVTRSSHTFKSKQRWASLNFLVSRLNLNAKSVKVPTRK